jgi:hypothetical protein
MKRGVKCSVFFCKPCAGFGRIDGRDGGFVFIHLASFFGVLKNARPNRKKMVSGHEAGLANRRNTKTGRPEGLPTKARSLLKTTDVRR